VIKTLIDPLSVYAGIPDMTPTSLAADIAPRTGRIIKKGLRVFERGENILQNGILH